jgi:restriction system protein
MHWRKFEELTAEYFKREGFNVELGPGSNDDGIDVRVWTPTQDMASDPPHMIIQCKRQKDKVEKVVVKGLYADVQFQNAECGLIVTTSELSPGAKKVISIRGYPIEEINNAGLRKWLTALQVPGSGIVRV